MFVVQWSSLHGLELPTLGWEIPVDLGVELGENGVWGGEGIQQGCDVIEAVLQS